MRVLVLAEDRYIDPIREIVRRVGGNRKVKIVPLRGNRIQKLVGYMEHHPNYDRFVVLKDLERYEEDVLSRRFNEIASRLSNIERSKVIFIVVRKAVEAWLLADLDAVERATGCRISRRTRSRLTNPEAVDNPKKELTAILRKCGKKYNIRLVARIASYIELERARQKSPSLDAFLRAISPP